MYIKSTKNTQKHTKTRENQRKTTHDDPRLTVDARRSIETMETCAFTWRERASERENDEQSVQTFERDASAHSTEVVATRDARSVARSGAPRALERLDSRAHARARGRRRMETLEKSNATKRARVREPSAMASAMALAFDTARGDAFAGERARGRAIDVETESDRRAFERACASENEECAIGVLVRDVVSVGENEIWFGFASNMRAADVDETKLAAASAKKFTVDGAEALVVRTKVIAFGVAFVPSGTMFLLRVENREMTRACLNVAARRRWHAYHAQRVVRAALDCGVTIDASTARVVDCRVDAWLVAPDDAHDGGIDDVDEALNGKVANRSPARWLAGRGALEQFADDLKQTIALCAQGAVKLERVSIARGVESRIAVLLGVLEHVGLGFDRGAARTMRDDASRRLDELKERAKVEIGMDINLSSAQQVGDVLYDKLKLPPPSASSAKGSKTSHRTTKDEVLTSLAKMHAFPQLVLDHRGTLKERAMCEGYDRAAIDGVDGLGARIHTEWNNTNTATGRLSSSNPNVQQVSNASKAKLREAFVPSGGRVFLAADYSQIELRCLAHLCNDERLVELLNRASDGGGDVFVSIWNAGKGLPLDAPCHKSTRDIAKRTTYGILYGQHANGLADKLNITKDEAKEHILAFHKAFPAVQIWINSTIREAEKRGVVVLPMSGRHRALPNINSSQFSERSEAQRQAVNTVVQGTAADMIKCAALRWASITGTGAFSQDIIPGSIDASRVRLVAQIHDELLFEVDENYVAQVAAAVRTCMERAMRLAVPTPVTIGVGKSWGALKPI